MPHPVICSLIRFFFYTMYMPPAGPGADSPTNTAARQPPTPRGFSDWSASTSAFTSLVQNPPSSNAANAYHYSLSPCYAFWTHYMLNKNAYSYYPAPNQEHGHPFYHDNNQAKDPGKFYSPQLLLYALLFFCRGQRCMIPGMPVK
jgi:hypothetical protein